MKLNKTLATAAILFTSTASSAVQMSLSQVELYFDRVDSTWAHEMESITGSINPVNDGQYDDAAYFPYEGHNTHLDFGRIEVDSWSGSFDLVIDGKFAPTSTGHVSFFLETYNKGNIHIGSLFPAHDIFFGTDLSRFIAADTLTTGRIIIAPYYRSGDYWNFSIDAAMVNNVALPPPPNDDPQEVSAPGTVGLLGLGLIALGLSARRRK